MVTCVKCSKIALIVGAILVSLIIGSYFGINQFLKVQIHKVKTNLFLIQKLKY